jgi:hypothetical protein
MISKCAFAVRNIFWARGRLTHDESNELQDWASLVNEALEQEKELWRKVSPEALRAYDGFKELIESSDRE